MPVHARAHGVVVSHPLRMRKALGSIPSVSIGVKQPRRRTIPNTSRLQPGPAAPPRIQSPAGPIVVGRAINAGSPGQAVGPTGARRIVRPVADVIFMRCGTQVVCALVCQNAFSPRARQPIASSRCGGNTETFDACGQIADPACSIAMSERHGARSGESAADVPPKRQQAKRQVGKLRLAVPARPRVRSRARMSARQARPQSGWCVCAFARLPVRPAPWHRKKTSPYDQLMLVSPSHPKCAQGIGKGRAFDSTRITEVRSKHTGGDASRATQSRARLRCAAGSIGAHRPQAHRQRCKARPSADAVGDACTLRPPSLSTRGGAPSMRVTRFRPAGARNREV